MKGEPGTHDRNIDKAGIWNAKDCGDDGGPSRCGISIMSRLSQLNYHVILFQSCCPHSFKLTMSVLDKFRKGAVKAGIQASAFIKEGSSRVQSSSQSFAQGFSLPGEAEKAAKILASFLGLFPAPPTRMHPETH